MKTISLFITLFATTAAFAGKTAPPQHARAGVQAIGLNSWARSDIDRLASLITQTPQAGAEVSLLVGTFKEPPHLRNIERLTRRTIHAKRLTVTFYLYFGHNWKRDAELDAFSKRFSQCSAEERAFRREFKRNTDAVVLSMEQMRREARGRRLARRLDFVICPVLEDYWRGSKTHYTNTLQFIEKRITKLGASRCRYSFRRCPDKSLLRSGNPRIAGGVALELHGRAGYDYLRIHGGRGDVYSPDGDFIYGSGERSTTWRYQISGNEQISIRSLNSRKRVLLTRGVATNIWLPVLNGLHQNNTWRGRYIHPTQRGRIHPFTRQQGEFSGVRQEAKALSFLKAK